VAPVGARPAPALVAALPSRWRQLRDLYCLIGVVAGAAPLPSALWGALKLGQGLLVPFQLWLTKNVVDALAAQLGGSGGQEASLWPVWLALLAGALLVQRALDGRSPDPMRSVRRRAGRNAHPTARGKLAPPRAQAGDGG
jgi:hypothetical protein